MSRKNIFELLETELDLNKEINRLQDLLDECMVESELDSYIRDWKYKKGRNCIDEIREDLLIDRILKDSGEIKLALRYLEYAVNIFMLYILHSPLIYDTSSVYGNPVFEDTKYIKEKINFYLNL